MTRPPATRARRHRPTTHAVGVVALALTLTGCGSSTDAVEPAAYGCALTAALLDGDPPTDWDLEPGPDTSSELVATSAITYLLGAGLTAAAESDADLTDAAASLSAAVSARDAALITTSLEHLDATCDASGTADDGLETSPEGRLDYACRLAAAAHDSGPVDDWLGAGTEADTQDTRTLTEAFGAASLTGGAVAAHLSGHEELSMAGQDLFTGLVQADAGGVEDSLAAMTVLCEG